MSYVHVTLSYMNSYIELYMNHILSHINLVFIDSDI